MLDDKPGKPETADGRLSENLSRVEFLRRASKSTRLKAWSRIKARAALYMTISLYFVREFMFLLFWGFVLWISWPFLPGLALRVIVALAGTAAIIQWRIKRFVASWHAPTFRYPLGWFDEPD